jgi:hypothetical protein
MLRANTRGALMSESFGSKRDVPESKSSSLSAETTLITPDRIIAGRAHALSHTYATQTPI